MTKASALVGLLLATALNRLLYPYRNEEVNSFYSLCDGCCLFMGLLFLKYYEMLFFPILPSSCYLQNLAFWHSIGGVGGGGGVLPYMDYISMCHGIGVGFLRFLSLK